MRTRHIHLGPTRAAFSLRFEAAAAPGKEMVPKCLAFDPSMFGGGEGQGDVSHFSPRIGRNFSKGKIRHIEEVKSCTSREASGEKYREFSWANSSDPAFYPIPSHVLCRSPPLPGPARPLPRSRPGPRSRPCPSCPLLPSPAQVRHLRPNFSLSTVFLPGHTVFFPHIRKKSGKGKIRQQGKNSVQKGKLTALKRLYTQRRAAQNVVPRHLVELQPSAYTILRKSLQLSQISLF